MTSKSQVMAGLIADGLDPATVERVLVRVSHLCRLTQQNHAARPAGENCDTRWVSGYAGAWGDCAEQLAHLAGIVAGSHRDAAPRDEGRR